MKIRPVGAELFHADIDMTKLKAACHNFANAPKTPPTQKHLNNNELQ